MNSGTRKRAENNTAAGRALGDEEERGDRGVGQEITTGRRTGQLVQLEHTVTSCLAEADSVSTALRALLRAICESEGWECGQYWRVDEKAGLLRPGEFWIVPGLSREIGRFFEKSQGVVFRRGDGLMGEVWQSGEPAWVADIDSDSRVMHKEIARDTGLRSTFRFPVTGRGRTIGIFDFSGRRIRKPDRHLLQAVRMIGSQIGQFLQRQQVEDHLRQSEARFRATFEQAAVGISHNSADDGRFLMVNDKLCEILGYPRAELMQKTFKDISHPEDRGLADEPRARLLAGEISTFSVEKRNRRRDGEHVWVRTTVSLARDAASAVEFEIAVVEDISARKNAEEQVHYLATHDGLTGLPNRTLFSEHLNLAIESARRYGRQFAVMFMDLDRFKAINDTLGHEAGDMLLQEMGKRLKHSLRSSDVVARLGGDEFVVLLQEIADPARVKKAARTLLSAILRPMLILEQECRVTGSIGISMYPKDAQDGPSLMKNADNAMYLAKAEGKNNFQFYSTNIKTLSFEKMSLENHLRTALERHEFSLDYQAKINLKSNAITGMEALLRWHSPQLGEVSPAHLLPVAEETGLIVPIGKWVLKTACSQNVAWQREGLPALCVAVNLSPRQFNDENLLSDLAAVLRETGMDPDLLELEVTESMVMGNVDRAIKRLAAIKKMGIRLAIDDFGTGYSSLAQIKRFPIDTLKVDRSFIRTIISNEENREITEAIIAMGKTLSLTVVAEGVESSEQETFLREHACDESQGYHFSKPLPPDGFTELLRRHVPA